mmetsp:Transcript_46830/g.74778  ORF Transcript_46830/g.74778 Transcript_46830/m.74778 type:complete len:292 (-) Transcript_46830:3-878(-)
MWAPWMSPHILKMSLNIWRWPSIRAASSPSMKLESSVFMPKNCSILKATCASGKSFSVPGGNANVFPPVSVLQSCRGGGATRQLVSGKFDTFRTRACWKSLTERSNLLDLLEVCIRKPFSNSRRDKSKEFTKVCIAVKKPSSSTKPTPPAEALSKILLAAASSKSAGQSSATRRCAAAYSVLFNIPSASASHHRKTRKTASRSSSSNSGTLVRFAFEEVLPAETFSSSFKWLEDFSVPLPVRFLRVNKRDDPTAVPPRLSGRPLTILRPAELRPLPRKLLVPLRCMASEAA